MRTKPKINRRKEKTKIRVQRNSIKIEHVTLWGPDFKPHVACRVYFKKKNPQDSIKKLLEIINKFSKVLGNKTNIKKSVACLYTNNLS